MKNCISSRHSLSLGWFVCLTLLGIGFCFSQVQAKIYGSGHFNLNEGAVYSNNGIYIGTVDFSIGSTLTNAGLSINGTSSLNLSGSNSYGSVSVTLSGSDTSYASAQYTLTITALNGSVTRSPDLATYTYNTQVALTATPDAGYLFLNWTLNGSVYSTSPQTTINLISNRELVANFIPVSRIMELDGSLLTWDLQAVKAHSTASFAIKNTGNSPLNISQITYPVGFSGDWAGQIAPGASQTVSVVFHPTAPGTYSGNVEIVSDATSGNTTLAVSAQAKMTYTISAYSKFGRLKTSTEARTYWSGSSVRMRAFPVLNYTFKNWTENGRIVSTSRSFKFKTYRIRKLRANYVPLKNVLAD